MKKLLLSGEINHHTLQRKMRSFIRFIGFVFVLSLWLHGCSHRAERPNIILLTLDTLRSDALGCYGNAKVKTPHLDRLAREGVLFEDAVCQIPATLTSHTAIMTGRNPKTTGVRFRTARVSPFEETLAERLNDYGYQTAAFISSYVLSPDFGLNQGFDLYELGSIYKDEKKTADERLAQETVEQALSYLSENRENPFFLWIHLYDPHSPYHPPPPYSTMYDPDYDGPLRGSVADITRLNAHRGQGASDRDLQHLRALYDGEVAYMDHQIGRLTAKLEEWRILDETIMAVMADHGENLGEEGRYFHGDDLYQPAVHIPFFIRYPKKIASRTRIRQFVQSIDLFPTLMDLTDIPMISGVEGKSLLPLIGNEVIEEQSKTGADYESQPGYLETEADALNDSSKLYGLRTDAHKFIFNSAHRRSDSPLGVFTEIPLKGPTLIVLRIQGDPSVRLMAHVRYRTRELYQSRDFQALASLNTTVVHAETAGVEPLQQQAMAQKSFHATPEGWRMQMTPDIHRLARRYGQAQGWPIDWMVLEGVGVDASLPARQKEGEFTVDQIELYAPSLRFPESPRYRNPFWVIEDFESGRGLIDAGEGPPHSIQSSWESERLFGGRRQQKIKITFNDIPDADSVDELFLIQNDPLEKNDLLTGSSTTDANKKLAENCRILLDDWISRQSDSFEILELDASHFEALEALGYTR
ncbi:MAG: sulfatase [Candidatus Omnitrophica bacterium]|nr:sulfatase [Candidatus Omnitrophota bacterium]